MRVVSNPEIKPDVGGGPKADSFASLYHDLVGSLDLDDVIPKLAKDPKSTRRIEAVVQEQPTSHQLILGDARTATALPKNSIHLVVTSPPYWNLKRYNQHDAQLGHVDDYDTFIDGLDTVWKNCYEALVPGGRLVINVGDVCLSRKKNNGRHTVVPLHATIQEHCKRIGYDNLSPIIWHKISNASYEAEGGGGGFLGKPYEPNAVIKNDIEFILMQRKPGGYRSPTKKERLLSIVPSTNYQLWFRQIWNDLTGASTGKHPAPYPAELAERLIRMFSFVGDTVLDPFMGTGSTNVAAARWGRHSIGTEIDPSYLDMARRRMSEFDKDLYFRATVKTTGGKQ
ncbi:MAG: site-specific DNA-methyltransferase [Tepidisphaera sp.]